jgi:hypothetical protein
MPEEKPQTMPSSPDTAGHGACSRKTPPGDQYLPNLCPAVATLVSTTALVPKSPAPETFSPKGSAKTLVGIIRVRPLRVITWAPMAVSPVWAHVAEGHLVVTCHMRALV